MECDSVTLDRTIIASSARTRGVVDGPPLIAAPTQPTEGEEGRTDGPPPTGAQSSPSQRTPAGLPSTGALACAREEGAGEADGLPSTGAQSLSGRCGSDGLPSTGTLARTTETHKVAGSSARTNSDDPQVDRHPPMEVACPSSDNPSSPGGQSGPAHTRRRSGSSARTNPEVEGAGAPTKTRDKQGRHRGSALTPSEPGPSVRTDPNDRQVDRHLPLEEGDASRSPNVQRGQSRSAQATRTSRQDRRQGQRRRSRAPPVRANDETVAAAAASNDPRSNAVTSGDSGRVAGRQRQRPAHNRKRLLATAEAGPPAPPPVYCDFPVIVAQTGDTSSVSLRSLDWKMADLLRNSVGPVKSIKPIGAKFLVGCTSAMQQGRLVRTKKTGQITVDCSIPVPTVEGVVRGIPVEVNVTEIQSNLGPSLASDGSVMEGATVKKVARLSLGNGEPSRAIRVTFAATQLPAAILIKRREYAVSPYVQDVVRCYRCQRYGHLRKQCKARHAVCGACGGHNHTAVACTAPVRTCPNCGGKHSAGAKACPTRKEWTTANQLRAEAYMPRAQAMRLAKQQLAATVSKPPSAGNSEQANTVPKAGWRPEVTYATVAGGRRATGASTGPQVTPPEATLSRDKPREQPPRGNGTREMPQPGDAIAALTEQVAQLTRLVLTLATELATLKGGTPAAAAAGGETDPSGVTLPSDPEVGVRSATREVPLTDGTPALAVAGGGTDLPMEVTLSPAPDRLAHPKVPETVGDPRAVPDLTTLPINEDMRCSLQSLFPVLGFDGLSEVAAIIRRKNAPIVGDRNG